ncbi:MAG: DUF3786 domain-containing protein [Anaerolineales bacterium]|nr:DUF3786 domain-containing protein [Anaerolineales bacterium]
MAGLTDEAGGAQQAGSQAIDQARSAWKESMLRRLETLRSDLRGRSPHEVADMCGATYDDDRLRLQYWGRPIAIAWNSFEAFDLEDKKPCSVFDTAMLIYYLNTSDGAPLADRWIAFRELPSGGFYHKAFQGYSGDLLARTIGEDPKLFDRAAQACDGWRLTALAPQAYAFLPLPRIRLAAALWPGDEDFPSRASVLFDAASYHYMTTDGLALLGAGLARRLMRATQQGS